MGLGLFLLAAGTNPTQQNMKTQEEPRYVVSQANIDYLQKKIEDRDVVIRNQKFAIVSLQQQLDGLWNNINDGRDRLAAAINEYSVTKKLYIGNHFTDVIKRAINALKEHHENRASSVTALPQKDDVMTTRDIFAASAIGNVSQVPHCHSVTATIAYKIADAMIEERKKK